MNRLSTKKRTWQESFEALLRYKAKHGNCLVPIHSYKEDLALGGWVNHQRSKKAKLSEEQRQKLDSVGFAWSVRNRNKAWNLMIDALQDYKSLHGDVEVPEIYQANQKLSDFVKEQRSKYHKGQLSAARQKQLEEIGLILADEDEEEDGEGVDDDDDSGIDSDQEDGDEERGEEDEDDDDDDNGQAAEEEEEDKDKIKYDNAFKQQYQKLVDFHIKYGHCRVPKFSRRGDTLGLWISNLRRKHSENPNNGGMDSRCFELLDELDFFNESNNTSSAFFSQPTICRRKPASKLKLPTRRSSVKKEEDGDGDDDEEDIDSTSSGAEESDKDDDDDDNNIDNEDANVAEDEEEDLLSENEESEISDDDDKEKVDSSDNEISDESDTESKVSSSSSSSSSSGSSSSSSSSSDDDSDGEDNADGSKEKKKKKKKKKKKRRLSDSSAARRCNYRDERFMKQYNDLLEFKRIHGHCRVPQSKKFKTLGGWVNNLRVMHNRDPVNGVRPDRRKKLDEAGFIWNAGSDRPGNDARWEAQYKNLVEFKKQFSHCRVPQTGPHRKLGRWVATQRALYVKDPANGIRADRLQRLNDIEFTWDAKGFKGKHFYSLAARGEKPRPRSSSSGAATATTILKADSSATESDDDDDDDDDGEGPVAAQVEDEEDDGDKPSVVPSSTTSASEASRSNHLCYPGAYQPVPIYSSNALGTNDVPPQASPPEPIPTRAIVKTEEEEEPEPETTHSNSPLVSPDVEAKPIVKQVSLD